MSYLAATIKFGKREFPSPPWNPRVKKIRPVGLLRARSLHGARGTSARAASHSSRFLEGWFDIRNLGAVLDHVGSLGERRLTVAAATKDFHASSCF
jgi:hypothetical protein